MPYKSDSQRKFFNSPAGQAKLGPSVVNEFNQASKGMNLPNHMSHSAPQAPQAIPHGGGGAPMSQMGQADMHMFGKMPHMHPAHPKVQNNLANESIPSAPQAPSPWMKMK